jgi:2Fe-2S ferredoxin
MRLTAIDRDGSCHVIEAEAGDNLMLTLRAAGLPIRAECGGHAVCASCHLYVDEPWLARLPDKDDDEEETLDSACLPRANSRLACRIELAPDLDGLAVTLAPDWL